MKRGYPDQPETRWKDFLTLDYFFKINKQTPEKLAYAEKIIKEDLRRCKKCER